MMYEISLRKNEAPEDEGTGELPGTRSQNGAAGLTCGKLVSGFRPQRSSYCFAAAADDDVPECLAKKSKVLGQEAAACSRYLGEPRLANAWAASGYE